MWNLKYIRGHDEAFKALYNLCTLTDLAKIIEKERRNLPQIKGRELSRLQKKDLAIVFKKDTNKVINNCFPHLLTKMVIKKSKITEENIFDEKDILKLSFAKIMFERLQFKSINFDIFIYCIYEDEVVHSIFNSSEYEQYKESDETLKYREVENEKEKMEVEIEKIRYEYERLSKAYACLETNYKKIKVEFSAYKEQYKIYNYKDLVKQILVKEKLEINEYNIYINDDFVSTLDCICKHESELNELLRTTSNSSGKLEVLEKYIQLILLKYIILKINDERGGFEYE